VNWAGRDGASAAVEVAGTAEASAPARASLPISPAPMFADLAQERIAGPAAPAEAAPQSAQRSFCVVPGMDFSRRARKAATLVESSAHADFFVDDEDLGHYAPGFFRQIAAAFEQSVWPADARNFGLPTDVDENEKMLVLFTHELGAHLHGGWLIGYFANGDLLRSRDASADCSDTGSNHGEIV
jgi:hypothetical protein